MLDWIELKANRNEPVQGPFWYRAETPAGYYTVIPQLTPRGAFDCFTATFVNNGRVSRGPATKFLGEGKILGDAKSICEQHADRLARGGHDADKFRVREHRLTIERQAEARLAALRKRDVRPRGAPVCVDGVERGKRELSRKPDRGAGGKVQVLPRVVREHEVRDRDAGAVDAARDVQDAPRGNQSVRDAQSLGYAGLDDLSLRGWIACYWPTRQVTWQRMKIREAIYILRARRRAR